MGLLLRKVSAVLMSSMLATCAQAELRLYTEEAAPLAFSDNGHVRGMSVEIVKELIARTESQGAVLKIVPWTRGYYKAQREPNTAIFSTVRTPEREDQFQWVGPILVGTTSFYSLKSRNVAVNTLVEAQASGPLAVPKLWYTYDVLSQMGFHNLYGVTTAKNMVVMLKHGRVNLIATQDVTLKDELASGGLKPADVVAHVPFMHSIYYIAFSLQTDPAIVATWQQALDEMRADGAYATIFESWLPDANPQQALP